MVSLFDGEFDYSTFLTHLATDIHMEASLEWFGTHVKEVLKQDRERITRLVQPTNAKAFLQARAVPV